MYYVTQKEPLVMENIQWGILPSCGSGEEGATLDIFHN